LDTDKSGELSREEFEALNDIMGFGQKKKLSMNDLFTLLDEQKEGIITSDAILGNGPEVSR
jgi:Ca2+-binding EF-hand superfamily protein